MEMEITIVGEGFNIMPSDYTPVNDLFKFATLVVFDDEFATEPLTVYVYNMPFKYRVQVFQPSVSNGEAYCTKRDFDAVHKATIEAFANAGIEIKNPCRGHNEIAAILHEFARVKGYKKYHVVTSKN